MPFLTLIFFSVPSLQLNKHWRWRFLCQNLKRRWWFGGGGNKNKKHMSFSTISFHDSFVIIVFQTVYSSYLKGCFFFGGGGVAHSTYQYTEWKSIIWNLNLEMSSKYSKRPSLTWFNLMAWPLSAQAPHESTPRYLYHQGNFKGTKRETYCRVHRNVKNLHVYRVSTFISIPLSLILLITHFLSFSVLHRQYCK